MESILLEFLEKTLNDLNDDHPKDCLCGIKFENGVSPSMELTKELAECLRDTDMVRFIKNEPFIEWGRVKNHALDTFMGIQIKERKAEPEKYYFYDEVKGELTYLGYYDNYIDAECDTDQRYPTRSGYTVKDEHIRSMYALLQALANN